MPKFYYSSDLSKSIELNIGDLVIFQSDAGAYPERPYYGKVEGINVTGRQGFRNNLVLSFSYRLRPDAKIPYFTRSRSNKPIYRAERIPQIWAGDPYKLAGILRSKFGLGPYFMIK